MPPSVPPTMPDAQGGPPRSFARRAADFWLAAFFTASERWPGFVGRFQGAFCRAAFRCSRQIRTATLANAARILGPGSSDSQRERLARGVLRSFYQFCLDVGRSTSMSRDQLLAQIADVQGRDHYNAARQPGKGLIVVTAHMGSFEVGLAELTTREPRIHVIFRRDVQGGFERQRSSLRRRLNVIENPVDDGWTMWIGLRDAVAAGDAVVFQGDRVMPGQKGRRVPFLHGTLELPTGPVKMARLTGAPILPIFTVRQDDGRILVIIDPPITAADDQPSTDGSDALLRKLALAIERRVAEYPDQWLMFHPAFCEDQPPRQPTTARVVAP